MEGYQPTRALITVMTYPHASRGYQELVCTAGITAAGEWVRLYPIDYRYRPAHQQFKKYQWIEINLAPSGHGKDNRKESRKPDLDSLRLLGEPLSWQNDWRERRVIIEALPVHTLNELKRLYEVDKTSLGLVKPKRVLDLIIEPAEPEWKPQWQALYDQLKLFCPPPHPPRKIPHKIHYQF